MKKHYKEEKVNPKLIAHLRKRLEESEENIKKYGRFTRKDLGFKIKKANN